jgi:hypothetical protein
MPSGRGPRKLGRAARDCSVGAGPRVKSFHKPFVIRSFDVQGRAPLVPLLGLRFCRRFNAVPGACYRFGTQPSVTPHDGGEANGESCLGDEFS